MELHTNYLNQSLRNFEFLKKNIEAFPDEFYGWKIIVCFYCGLHLMKALLWKKYNISVQSHPEIEHSIKEKVKPHVWKSYRNNRVESEKCRYDGHEDPHFWDILNKGEFKRCLSRLKEINNEVIKKGIESPFTNDEIDKLILLTP